MNCAWKNKILQIEGFFLPLPRIKPKIAAFLSQVTLVLTRVVFVISLAPAPLERITLYENE
jgi:hypothetical protein